MPDGEGNKQKEKGINNVCVRKTITLKYSESVGQLIMNLIYKYDKIMKVNNLDVDMKPFGFQLMPSVNERDANPINIQLLGFS